MENIYREYAKKCPKCKEKEYLYGKCLNCGYQSRSYKATVNKLIRLAESFFGE